MARTRKTPQTWIEAGLQALEETGPSALQAETLARALHTTKGSFYWHFQDVADFHKALLDTWAKRCIGSFEHHLDPNLPPEARLRHVAVYVPTKQDQVIRSWASFDPTAKKARDQCDDVMISHLADLLSVVGARHPDFPSLVHAAIVQQSASRRHAETLVDLIIALK